MNEGKWGACIPFSEDDLKMCKARELAEEIEESYRNHNVQVIIRKKGYNPCYGDGFKFQVKLGDRTRIENIERLIPTMRVNLRQPHLQYLSENGVLYLTTYSPAPLSIDNDLRHCLHSEEYRLCFQRMKIAHPVGVNADGIPKICDLAEYPHAMICGTTMSGKSTALKCLLTTLAYYPDDDINLLIADRGSDLSVFGDLPHCSCPIIHDPNEFTNAILLLEEEMNRRNEMDLSERHALERLPYIICVIDEFSWFINNTSHSEETIAAINSILEYGRHTKIHMVVAIHDPKRDIMKVERTNLRVQLAFETVNSRKSSTILGDVGAEKLHGRGEMIFHRGEDTIKLRGFNVDDDELAKVCANECTLGTLAFSGVLSDNISDDTVDSSPCQKHKFVISAGDLYKRRTESLMSFTSTQNVSSNKDEQEHKFSNVVLWVLSQTSVSINSIQKVCGVGNYYARDFYNSLTSYGVLGGMAERGRRTVILQSIEDMPSELRDRLDRCGITDDDIVAAIAKRPTDTH